MRNSPRHVYEFGPFRLDPERHRLFRNSEPVPLAPRDLDALLVLVRNAGRPIEREELIQAIWLGSFVEDANLTVAISHLRKALGQNGEGTDYIETIPRVGYRFRVPVREIHDTPAPLIIEKHTMSRTVIEEEEETPALPIATLAKSPLAVRTITGTWRRPILFGTIVLVALGTAGALFFEGRAHRPNVAQNKPITSLAVLPFRTLNSTTNDDEYLGLGLSDSLITRLSNVRQFVVRPIGAVQKFTGPNQDVLAAGKELGVDSVLDGRIQHNNDRIIVNVQLLRVSDGRSLWAESFNEPFSNILSVQDSISNHLASSLLVKLTSQEQQQFAKRGTENAEAFAAYLRGRYAWNKRTPDEIRKAIKLFQQAIDLDPTYATAYAGMADCYISLGDYGNAPARDVFPLAKGSALKALEIDDSLAEAHTALAHATFLYDWNWSAAEREYLRAIELNPNYATAHHWYGWFLIANGRFDDALREVQRAKELDPLSLIIKSNVGTFQYFSRHYDESIRTLREVVNQNESFVQGRRKLAFSLETKGLEDEAVAEWLKVEEQLGDDPAVLEKYRAAIQAAGLKGYWRQALEVELVENRINGGRASAIATYYARLGDRDEAFRWLAKAYENREPWLVYTKISPVYDNLRDDPRFDTFLIQMGLN